MNLSENKQLQAGIESLGLSLSDGQLEKLSSYIELMLKWNKVHNLTAITNVSEIIVKHILDSLSIFSFIAVNKVLDIGTGAGLPGIPLAIACPDKQFVLLDSARKRTDFLQMLTYKLPLDNIQVVHSRVEDYQAEQFQQVVTRAFAPLNDIMQKSAHLLTDTGQLLAMKGQIDEKELATAKENYTIAQIEKLTVPQLVAERNLIFIQNQ